MTWPASVAELEFVGRRYAHTDSATMALWQFETVLIPSERVIAEFGAVEVQMDRSRWDAIDWWSEHQPPVDFSARIATLLPPYQSWSPFILNWGSKDSDRVDVCLTDEQSRVEELSVRVDLRHPVEPFARLLASLAEQLGCVCAVWPFRTFEPTVECLLAEIGQSEAARYVRGPRVYFEELARDPDQQARGWTRH